jgi:hypothetical protein
MQAKRLHPATLQQTCGNTAATLHTRKAKRLHNQGSSRQ